MKKGMNGISKAIRPTIGSSEMMNNCAKNGSAFISSTIGISTFRLTSSAPSLSPRGKHPSGHSAHAKRHYLSGDCCLRLTLYRIIPTAFYRAARPDLWWLEC